jgi:hypothetical protein
MKMRTGALLLSLLADGCSGLGAGATESAEVLGVPVPSTDSEPVKESAEV